MIKIKILHIINDLGSGGAEKLIEETLPIMKKNHNVNVEILLLSKKNNVFYSKLKQNNIKINVIGTDNIYNFLNLFSIRKFIKKNNFDIIHSHLFPTIYWVSLASMTLINKKYKLILTEHSTNNRRRSYNFFRLIDKFIYNEYDKVISISKNTQDNLLNWLKLEENNKFTIIENGIDISKFNNAKPYQKNEICSECSRDNIFLTMIGRFSHQKDQKTLIKSLKYLDDNIHLLLVGRGDLLENHKKYVKKVNLDNRVHFLGFRNDVDRILKSSDIVILSSYWEGFGLAAVEGMASNKPVIVSDVKGLKEIVNGFGLLFEQGNEKELSFLINKLISDQDFYNEISNKCYNRAKDYNIRKMTNNLIKVYEKLSI